MVFLRAGRRAAIEIARHTISQGERAVIRNEDHYGDRVARADHG